MIHIIYLYVFLCQLCFQSKEKRELQLADEVGIEIFKIILPAAAAILVN